MKPQFRGYDLAGCADRAGLIVRKEDRALPMAADWNRFANEVLNLLEPQVSSAGRFALDVVATLTKLAIKNQQVVGGKNDYYVTLEQLQDTIGRWTEATKPLDFSPAVK